MRARAFYAAVSVLALAASPVAAQEPALPPGLGGLPSAPNIVDEPDKSEEPSLPAGLGGLDGLDATKAAQKKTNAPLSLPVEFSGFIEGRAGYRVQPDPVQGAATIGEARARFEAEAAPGAVVVRVAADAVFDAVVTDRTPTLENGAGAIDLREANIVWRPTDFADLKVGRQILTWGVGDFVFINDLFPKDFEAFFIGRDDEYLKAPSDAARLSLFSGLANLDLIYTPRFDADRFIDGERLSYFNPLAGGIVGEETVLEPVQPDRWFRDDEFAGRLYRQLGAYELAAYGYHGFFKGPSGINAEGRFFFPRLASFGASLRGPLRGGILTAEFGRYLSLDDQTGANPAIPNSQTRVLAGFEKEVATETTLGVQYYAEIRDDQDAFLASLPQGAGKRDQTRHLITLRLTRLAMNQNLTLSAFNFWSPNEDDGHLRLRASYKVNDDWRAEIGGNVFYGPRRDIFFSQLKDNSNIFVGVRRGF